MPLRKAVFFDRDGVINKEILRHGVVGSPSSVSELEIYPEIVDVLRTCRKRDYLAIIVTNQPGIARGTLNAQILQMIHQQLITCLEEREAYIDAIYICPHDDQDQCSCRKPKPGMLLRAAEELHIDLTSSYLIGDRSRDIEAGWAAGCRTILLQKEYNAGMEADIIMATLKDLISILQ